MTSRIAKCPFCRRTLIGDVSRHLRSDHPQRVARIEDIRTLADARVEHADDCRVCGYHGIVFDVPSGRLCGPCVLLHGHLPHPKIACEQCGRLGAFWNATAGAWLCPEAA
jgi:hypothetical protein